MPSIKFLLWDVGGVLLRTEDPTPRQHLAAELGTTRRELEKTVFASEMGTNAQLGKISVDELWEFVRQAYDLTPQQLLDFRQRFWAGDRLDRALVDEIRRLRARGYLTGILSNAWGNLRSALQDDWKIADAFDFITTSAEEGVMKPDPRIYHIALERAGVAPQQAVFIDDFPHNIEGARAVGMHAILFDNRTQVFGELEALLDKANPG